MYVCVRVQQSLIILSSKTFGKKTKLKEVGRES
jgi:hypothetical protein